jgi:HK97 family phage major capsid protein
VVSAQLLAQAPELAEPMIRRNAYAAIGYALDVGCLVGLAGPEPIGILNNPAIASTVTFSTTATLAKAANFERQVADSFAEQGSCSYISSPAAREKWRTLQKWSGSSTALWSDDDEILGHPAIATPAISAADSRMVYGCWSLYQIILFGGPISVIYDPFTSKKTAQVEFCFSLRADAFPLNAEAFVKSTDAANQ